MEKGGGIMLDPALALKPKTLRVRVKEGENITGTSHLPMDADTDGVAIEKAIQLARDSAFEEELYHEMSIESRQLMAYGVEYRDSVIHVKAGEHSGRKLLIDCIPRENSIVPSQNHIHDWLAQNVAEGLRLLLAHEHSMRLHRRSQLPQPLTGQKRDIPPPALLRTLLAIFKHLEGVDSLFGYLEAIAKTLESAGMAVQLDTTREVSWARLAESLQMSSKESTSATDRLLDIFLKPFDGKAVLSLLSLSGAQPEEIEISTRTLIGQPTFGTEHRLTLPPSLVAELGLFRQLKFSAVEDAISYLEWVLSLHVARRLLKHAFAPRATIKGKDSRVTIQSRGTKKAPAADYDIMVELQDGKLEVSAFHVNSKTPAEDGSQSQVWTGQDVETSLLDTIKSWVG